MVTLTEQVQRPQAVGQGSIVQNLAHSIGPQVSTGAVRSGKIRVRQLL